MVSQEKKWTSYKQITLEQRYLLFLQHIGDLFVKTIPVGPLFNHPTTYSPVSTVAVSDSLLNAHESTSQVWHNS